MCSPNEDQCSTKSLKVSNRKWSIHFVKRIINEINFQFKANRLLMLDSYHESNFELIGFRCSYFYYLI